MIRNEGGRSQSLFFFFLLLFSLSACAKPKKVDHHPKSTESVTPKLVDLGAGDTTVYTTKEPNSPTSFTVNWEKGGFKSGDHGIEIGHLINVFGDLYSKGESSSRYRADRGDATRANKRLTMTGNVVLNSKDGTKSLHAPRAEYHGDAGFVRAMGGVTAEGPFGTLSGVPELWSTPDLRLIGTPDMVSKKLNLPVLAALAAVTAPATPIVQKGVDFKLENAASQLIEPLGSNGGYRFTAKPRPGISITITLPSKGIVIHSAGTVVVLTDAKGVEVRNLKTQGAVDVVQTAPGKKVTLVGNGADYDVKPGADTGNLEIGGRVTITSVSEDKDADGKPTTRTVISKGDHGNAVLYGKPPPNVDPIKSAILTGNVNIDIKGATGNFLGNGDRLVYTPNPTGARAVMTGKLSFAGDAPAYLGHIEGSDIATVNLDKNGWKDVTLENSGGKTTTTTIDKKLPPIGDKSPPRKKKKGEQR